MHESVGFDLTHLSWALFLGGLSAISLPLGSALGLLTQPPRRITAFLTGFGGGALIAALTIEIAAPTVAAVANNASPDSDATFGVFVVGCLLGGFAFTLLDDLVNAHGGFLRKSATVMEYFTTRRHDRLATILEDLGHISLLRHLSAAHVHDLVERVQPTVFERGATIFEEGDQGDTLYFIRSGKIDIFRDGKSFRELGEGDVLGEIAVLTGARRTAKAAAKERTQMLAISKAAFDQLRKVSPDLDQAARELATSRLDELRSDTQTRAQEAEDWVAQAIDAIDQGTILPSKDEIREASKEHSGAPLAIWLGILLDGVPESLVIGTGFLGLLSHRLASHGDVTLSEVIPYTLIAGLFLSNFPEALSSSVGMRQQGMRPGKVLFLWSTLTVMTAIGAGVGYVIGESLPHVMVIGIEGLAAGAMLTMIASTMLPEATHLGGGGISGMSTLVGFLSALAFKVLE